MNYIKMQLLFTFYNFLWFKMMNLVARFFGQISHIIVYYFLIRENIDDPSDVNILEFARAGDVCVALRIDFIDYVNWIVRYAHCRNTQVYTAVDVAKLKKIILNPIDNYRQINKVE